MMIDTRKLEDLLQFIKTVAVEAGQAIMEIYRQDFQVEMKTDNSPLTKADQRANTIIVSALQDHFPTHGILSEESKDDKSRLTKEYCWIVDPLDGTKEFVKRNGEFTVNIALARNGKAILGVVYAPELGDMYYAAEGLGAYYKSTDQLEYRIQVSDRTNHFRIATSRSHKSPQMQTLIEKNRDRIEREIAKGSSLKGCLVAKGEVDMYYRFGLTMEWDTAAMQCVVEEAGAVFRQMDDTPMRYNREDNLNAKGFYILNTPQNDLR